MNERQSGRAVEGLAPVGDASARLLVLGSMPGEASLKARQYYGHPRNQFWPLLYALLDGGEPPADYDARLAFARSRGVALWDVLRACERQGSLDSAIRKPEANAFAEWFGMRPALRDVFFNGQAAAALFRRHVRQDGWAAVLRFATLPSSSPAHALPFQQKLAGWQPLREAWLTAGAPDGDGLRRINPFSS